MIDFIIEYFSNMPSSHRTIILVSGLTIFWMIESIGPLFERSYQVGKHTIVNIFFTLTTALVNFPLAFILVKSSDWVVVNHFGIVQWLGLNPWMTMILGLLILDLIASWLVHYVEHHVKWMWKFHAIHHTDQHVDTTTANRHHPGESVFRFIFTLAAVVIVGAPMWLVFLYQTLSVVLTQFNHSNFLLNKTVDKILSWVFVTPNMHHVHHHYRMPYSDTNYGNIFSCWDRIFGTYINVDNSNIKYGLDTHMDVKNHSNILEMLKIPFQPYRNHIEYDSEEQLE